MISYAITEKNIVINCDVTRKKLSSIMLKSVVILSAKHVGSPDGLTTLNRPLFMLTKP